MDADERREHYVEGKQTFRNGGECQYPPGTIASNEWHAGYATAKRMEEKLGPVGPKE